MVQYKKDDVKEKINNAALIVFAEKGYEVAKVSDISKLSNVSVGNIYKYYKGKEDIFYSILPEAFVDELKKLIKNKILLWKSEENIRVENNTFMNEALTRLMIDNKERITILFKGSKNTKYENFKDEFIDFLTNAVVCNYKITENNDVDVENKLLFIRVIFKNLINMISDMMQQITTTEDLSKLLSYVNQYHMFGITEIIEKFK